jgi:hypothetical protein
VVREKTYRSQRWSARYYVCSDDQVRWRIPNTVHRELASGRLALPQFASTEQKILEVFVGRAHGAPVLLDARGSIYTCDSDGMLDLHPAAEALSSILEGSQPRQVQDHVIDIGPVLRSRKWVAGQTWQPSPNMLRAIRADLSASESSSSGRISIFKRSSAAPVKRARRPRIQACNPNQTSTRSQARTAKKRSAKDVGTRGTSSRNKKTKGRTRRARSHAAKPAAR